MHFVFDIGDRVMFEKEVAGPQPGSEDLSDAMPEEILEAIGEDPSLLTEVGEVVSFESEGGGEDLFYGVQFAWILLKRIPLCCLRIYPPPK